MPGDRLATAFIGIGANLGDREATIRAALDRLQAHSGVHRLEVSSLHETDPVGGPPGQPAYLNAAARLETELDPPAQLKVLLDIERDLGRERREPWGPRTLDLDLLLYENQVLDTATLTLPHPRMHCRRFVLAPMVEIAPNVQHPVLRLPLQQLLQQLQDASKDSSTP